MPKEERKKGTHLTWDDRHEIQKGLKEHRTFKEIAYIHSRQGRPDAVHLIRFPRKYAGIVIISCEAGMVYFMQVQTGVNTEIAAGVGMCVKRRRDISAEFHAGSVSAVISCVLTLWMHHAQ